ncbi:amino acid adenylation domain-containing protein [Streptomyces sp. CL7]|uniref:non-ribosomal peptide synthetase n=1 Tax=Streptomyces sp. CL7 TaxID=3096006 RepID=UPI002A7664C1|nr:amino acid adenylation domain-containing protein [Streptomyces sp. CL7]WPP34308.1 amino acid adenylation domain-containing protein [Streptomyces sp. CL7]
MSEPALADDEPFELPASFGQERLWLLDRVGSGNAYHLGGAVRLDGPLDPDALARAVARLVERHEILRSTLELSPDGHLVQLVHPDLPSPTARFEASEPTLAAARRTLAAHFDAPFDLAAGPLLRTALVRFGETSWLFGVSMHHIVSDGWSIGVFHTELAALYHAETGAGPARLPDLPIQYGDFAAWQRDTVAAAGPEFTDYWRERMAGAVPLEPAAPATAGAPSDVPVAVPAALMEAVARLAKQESATPFMVLTASYMAVLARWTERDDIVVGTPVAGRSRPELHHLVGFFVNTLPLRTRVDAESTFRDLLGAVRETCLGAFEHQDLPFERIVEVSGVDRTQGRPPLVGALIALENTPAPPWDVPGVTAERVDLADLPAQFSLNLYLSGTADAALDGRLVHDAHWDAADVRRLAEGWLALLTDALADPAKPVGRLCLGEVEDGAESAEPPVADGLVHHWVTAAAEEHPDRVAISDGGDRITYRELEERADRWARLLRAHGAGPERLVAVCMRRSIAQLVAALGILKSGAAYLPLDPGHPEERLARLVADAAPPVVLTDSATAGLFPAGTGAEILLADTVPDAARTGPLPDPPGLAPDSLAYVIHTSGSTGTPKGAMNTHRGLVNRVRWAQRVFGLAPGESVLHKTPWSFDVSAGEWLWPLTAGARIVLAEPGGHRDPRYLAGLIAEESVTTCHFVPSMLQAFLAEPAAARCADVLRRVQCSGETLPVATARRFREILPHTELWNLYGPAETAVDVSHHRVGPDDLDRPRLPIGHQLPGVRLHVLDRRGEPVPWGVPGELNIGGVAVGRGYLEAPALTAQRFVPDPFAADGTRLYRTGDRVRRLPDGALEFLGRYDHQVKLRGIRVELGEIEAALGRHPDVAQAAVLVRGSGADIRPVAYVGCPEHRPTGGDLRGFLLRTLPAALVPNTFVVLPALPVTRNGKLDRAALPDTGPGAPGRAATVPPRTPAEWLLTGIWADVLQLADVGIQDNFYELGGNSLRAVRVFQRAQEEGLLVPLEPMLGDHTVEQLAAQLGTGSGEALHDIGRLL